MKTQMPAAKPTGPVLSFEEALMQRVEDARRLPVQPIVQDTATYAGAVTNGTTSE